MLTHDIDDIAFWHLLHCHILNCIWHHILHHILMFTTLHMTLYVSTWPISFFTPGLQSLPDVVTSLSDLQIQKRKIGRSDSRFKTRQWNRKQTVWAEHMVVEYWRSLPQPISVAETDEILQRRMVEIRLKGAETKRRRREGGAIMIKCLCYNMP